MTTMKNNLTKSLFCLAIASSFKACYPYASSRYRCSYSSSRKDQQKAKREKIIKPFNLIKVGFCKRYPAVSAKAEQVVKVMKEHDRQVQTYGCLWPDIPEIKKQQIGEAIKAGKECTSLFTEEEWKNLLHVYHEDFKYKLELYQSILALFQEINGTFQSDSGVYAFLSRINPHYNYKCLYGQLVTAVENTVRIVKECIKVAEKNEQKVRRIKYTREEYVQVKRDIGAMISNEELEKLDKKEKEFWKWAVVVFERIKDISAYYLDLLEITEKIVEAFKANA